MITRRELLGSFAGALGSTSALGLASASDYRALIVLFLDGGNDGHNTIVPTDAAYKDYLSSRTNLALSKSSLVPLVGQSGGRLYGVHPALSELARLYERRRLAWIANVGPLVVPTSAEQALDSSVELPPYLLSHPDQIAIQQGWLAQSDLSGWAGRGLELLPSALRNPLAAVSLGTQRTLVRGRRSAVSYLLTHDSMHNWGYADLRQPALAPTQSLNRIARWQFANRYEAEFARTLGVAVADTAMLVEAQRLAMAPAGHFETDELSLRLRAVATLLPVFKSMGLRRQVFLVHAGGFDTHANQRGSGPGSQDTLLHAVGRAVAAFDFSVQAAGLDNNVVTLMMSDFGRTLRASSGGGSEHGWGNHWFAVGGPVAGGVVLGRFPDLTLGGRDDGDHGRNGRHVPTTATDQIGATVMSWLGLPISVLYEVFPNLVNFRQKTVPLLIS